MVEEKDNKENEEGKKKQDAIDAIVLRQKKQENFLKSLEGGVSVLAASKAADIDYKTIWRWRKDDEEFNNKVMAILDSRTMIVEDALFLNAAKGNLGAQIFYLKNRAKERWKDKIEEDINLNVHKGLSFEEFEKIKEMTIDEREVLIKKLSEIYGNKDSKLAGEDQGKDKG